MLTWEFSFLFFLLRTLIFPGVWRGGPRTPFSLAAHPLRSAGKQSNKVNRPLAFGFFLLYPARYLKVRPYAKSSKFSYTTTLFKPTDTDTRILVFPRSSSWRRHHTGCWCLPRRCRCPGSRDTGMTRWPHNVDMGVLPPILPPAHPHLPWSLEGDPHTPFSLA